MLVISRTIVNITYSVYVADTTQLYDHLFSSLCAFLLTLLMTVPVYLLYKKNNEHSVLDCGYNSLGKAGAVIAVVYAISFLWALCIYCYFGSRCIFGLRAFCPGRSNELYTNVL